jgi:hypothetical protein
MLGCNQIQGRIEPNLPDRREWQNEMERLYLKEKIVILNFYEIFNS